MMQKWDFNWFSCIIFFLLVVVVSGGGSSESEAFFSFIEAVDPQNLLNISWKGTLLSPCLGDWNGVKCNSDESIIEIRLDNLKLCGIIDADSLCKLPNLEVLSLANNFIHESVPQPLVSCDNLAYLNLSSNKLTGILRVDVTELKRLRILDVSGNPSLLTISPFKLGSIDNYTVDQSSSHMFVHRKLLAESGFDSSAQADAPALPENGKVNGLLNSVPLILGIGVLTLFLVLAFVVNKKVSILSKEKKILESLAHSAQKFSPGLVPKPEPSRPQTWSELVFFVNEEERFKLDDLFEATADLRSQTLCSSLYKVVLKNKIAYAVKRLKMKVSSEEFGRTMKQIGQMKHPNILPLVGYNSTSDEKLLIYKYQSNGSLLNLLEDYIAGKREFPWKLRLSIASGIARGLDFIYRNPDEHEIIPHGNLKLSNILLGENKEPLISEYGYSKFLDPKKSCSLSYGYIAPEKTLSEKGDVYSFGVMMLELLTGKTVENSGIDLPKWVRAMVREEWTGEVFDREITEAAKHYAFPLLNVSLKCVSQSPEDRPAMAELLEKIDEVDNAHEDVSISSMASMESSATARDFSLLHSVIDEAWDTPASNY